MISNILLASSSPLPHFLTSASTSSISTHQCHLRDVQVQDEEQEQQGGHEQRCVAVALSRSPAQHDLA